MREVVHQAWEAALRRAIVLPVLLTITVVFAVDVVVVALNKYFSIDEFQYAHAAWLVSGGEIPYRDFFQHYLPLLFHWLALPFLAGVTDPSGIILLRLLMLPFAAATAWALWRLSRELSYWALLAPIFLLSVFAYAERAIEIRPEGMATALFFVALAVVSDERLRPERRSVLAGVLAGASVLSSQKALLYGAAFAAALLIDVLLNRKKQQYLLAKPLRFCVGALVPLVGFAGYLTVTGSWSDWLKHSVIWSLHHQRHYEGFPVGRALGPVLKEYSWLFALAGIGVAVVVKRLVELRSDAFRDRDFLLLAALLSTFCSFALTKERYVYCLVPFIPAIASFAARGAVALGRTSLSGRFAPAAVFLTALMVGPGLLRAHERLLASRSSNSFQLETLRRIGRLTGLHEPVFDVAGAGVTRPHVLFRYYGDRLDLEQRAKEIGRETPGRLIEAGCVLMVVDRRFDLLPESLRRFLLDSYQAHDGDLRIWGRRYRPANRTMSDGFFAIRDGQYFVWPPRSVENGELRIDGRSVSESVFPLTKGMKSIRYSGDAPEFWILWLPADGVIWRPRPGLRPRFSIL